MNNNKIPPSLLANPIHLFSLGFGSGLSPVAPGTAGTLVAIPVYLLLNAYAASHVYLAIVLLFTVLGIWLCDKTAKTLGVHDHPGIVWDEVVGFLITMFAAPSGWAWIVAGFVLFRFFDILKPWPIRVIDKRLKGGAGIMMDDVMAGIFAWVVLQVIAMSIMYI